MLGKGLLLDLGSVLRYDVLSQKEQLEYEYGHGRDDADARRNPVSTEPLSVQSGRDMDDIAEDAK